MLIIFYPYIISALACAAACLLVLLSVHHYTEKYLVRETFFVLLGIAFGGAVGAFYPSAAAATLGVFFALLGGVTLADAATQEIPDLYSVLLLAVGVVSVFTMPGLLWWERALGMVCVSIPMLLLSLKIEGAFGGGDIKLMAACGLLLGWKLVLVAAFLAVLAGGAYGAWLLLRKKIEKKGHFAFGPFLCFGMAAAVLWGNELLHWYISLCGF